MPNIKIRGIYTTALSRLLLDLGYGIARPSSEIRDRIQLPDDDIPEDISIFDKIDRQGICVCGTDSLVEELIQRLWDPLLDMVVQRESFFPDSMDSKGDTVACDIEFPGASRTVLDSARGRVVPTMTGHHRLKIIASDDVDLIERHMEHAPWKQEKLQREFMDRFLYQPLKKRGRIGFEHVKPEKGPMRLREGEIISFGGEGLIVRRRFHGGRYNGLDLAIEPGDYGITEVVPGAWFLHHRYYAETGILKGEYINVNTPIELFPDRIRYVDLHVDVVRRGTHPPEIIDQEALESLRDRGFISPRLQETAMEIARRLRGQRAAGDRPHIAP